MEQIDYNIKKLKFQYANRINYRTFSIESSNSKIEFLSNTGIPNTLGLIIAWESWKESSLILFAKVSSFLSEPKYVATLSVESFSLALYIKSVFLS